MPKKRLEKSLKRFEKHSALRRKMLEIAGVKFGRGGAPKEIQAEIRKAMIECFEGENEEACQTWIKTASKGTPPPDFCQIRIFMSRLSAVN